MMSKQSLAFDIDRLSEALNGLQKCLECTICLDLMTTPVKTRCGHSFCQTCISKVLHQNASCPLCKETLNKRSISKDDHLESCIQKFRSLKIVIQTDSHVDVLSHLKQPRDTRESCSNSDSSQSNTSHKRKRMNRRSICSNQSIFKTNRPSTSRETVIDCDNPRNNPNSLIKHERNQTSSTNVFSADQFCPLSTDGNDNTLYDTTTPDIKVRTWIHSEFMTIIENEISMKDGICSNMGNMSQVDKDRKRKLSSDVRKTDFDSSKLKYNAIHAQVRTKDRKRFVDVGKLDDEELVCSFQEGSLPATSNDQTRQLKTSDHSTSHAINTSTVDDKPSSADATCWNRVLEVGKEMRGKKKKVMKLNVSTEKSVEKCDKDKENTEKVPNRNVPRIIEDIILPPARKYESFNNSGKNDKSNNNTNLPNQWRESDSQKENADVDKKPNISDVKVETKMLAKTTVRNLEESFTDNKPGLSTSQNNSQSLKTLSVITLEGGEKIDIKNLDSRQVSEIIDFEKDSEELVDDASDSDGRRHPVKGEGKEQDEDVEFITELFDSPSSHRQRLIVLTPEKLNESVVKSRASSDSSSRISGTTSVNPTSCLPDERETSVNNDMKRTMTTPDFQLQLLDNMRLSLKRNTVESPLFSQVPLMERLLIDKYYTTNLKSRKDINSSVSNAGLSFDQLLTVRRDLSSQISGKDPPLTGEATAITDNVSSKNTVVIKSNRNVVDSKPKELKRMANPAREKENCWPVKFMQLGTMIRRRDVKYYYYGATKRELCLPAGIQVTSVHNMQQSLSESEIQHRAEDKSHSLGSLSVLSNDSRDSTAVTVVENVHYVHKSAADVDNIVLETKRTPEAGAYSPPDCAETTAREISSTSVINKPLIAEDPRSPRTPCADQNATQQLTPRVNSHTMDSVRLLSPDRDSQLRFLTIDSPMSQHGQSSLASATRAMQPELERGSTFTKDNNLIEMRDSPQANPTLQPSCESSGSESTKKRKRNDKDEVDDDDDNSSVSEVSMSSQCTIKINREEHQIQNKTDSYPNVDEKCYLSLSYDRGDEVICLDADDQEKAHERRFKRIVPISDLDMESELPAHVAKKRNRNKSSDRCDQENASIMGTPRKIRKLAKKASDEDLRIRDIVNKWSNEAAQEKATHRRSFCSTNLPENGKCGNTKLSQKNTESDLFFESNSIFNSEGLEQLTVRQTANRASRSRKEQESPSSMDLLANDIINKVQRINWSQQNHLDVCRSTGIASRTNDDGASQKDKDENLLQDNSDEIIANVELPQSEGMIVCSELPAHHSPSRNHNRTLTEQNTSSCLAMTNESRDVERYMKPASSTADIFEHCGYPAGKNAKKAHQTSTTSGNSNKENTVSHDQRKHSHAEENRRDKKNVPRSPGFIDKAACEKIVPKINVSQEKRGSFDRVQVMEGTLRTEKEVNVPAESTSQANNNNNNNRVQRGASDDELDTEELTYDSIMNITLHQARLNMIEEDLFGVQFPRVGTKATKANLDSFEDDLLPEEQRTPKKKNRGGNQKNASSQGHSADEDDIVENTPETKMRNFPTSEISPLTRQPDQQKEILYLSQIMSAEFASRNTTESAEYDDGLIVETEQDLSFHDHLNAFKWNTLQILLVLCCQILSADSVVRNTSWMRTQITMYLLSNSDVICQKAANRLPTDNGKTIDSDTRRNVMTLNLSPIPSFSEQFNLSTSSRKTATSKSEHASTPLYRPGLMYPLYQSTPKVTSHFTTTGHRDDVSTREQLDTPRPTTSGAVSSETKWPADGISSSGNMCRQFNQGRLRFVCTGLTVTQIINVQNFARLHHVDYVKQFDSSVTHVIVNTFGEDNAAKSTLKYLQGIAHCKWVVSYKWVEDCIEQGKLLSEPPYEATTQSADMNGPGPRNSRLSHKGLFEDFTFFCIGPYDNVSLSQYQDLLRATGATVVNSLEALAAEKKNMRGVVIQGDTHENSTIESWYRNARAAPILIDWIVECIGHYRLFQLIPYIQTLTPQDYCAIGYSREIIGEEEYSDTSFH